MFCQFLIKCTNVHLQLESYVLLVVGYYFVIPDNIILRLLQNELDRLEMPAAIRRRIQSAMPILAPSLPLSIPCHLPILSPAAVTSLGPSTPNSGLYQRGIPARISNNFSSRNKNSALQEMEMDIDPWTLLEDGTSCASVLIGSSNTYTGNASGDHSNLKACSWLKGSVRVQRTDLTYIGALDEDIQLS